MRYLFLLLLFLCSNVRAQTFCPFWKTDTLINNYRIGGFDTLYSFKNHDTTGIIYHDTTLYVYGSFDTTEPSAFGAYIGTTPMNTQTYWSKCNISLYKWFYGGDNKYLFQQQMISIINRYPNFSTIGDANYFGKP